MESSRLLLEMLRDSELVRRTKELKSLVENNFEYGNGFRRLIELQKKMVRSDQFGNEKSYQSARTDYESGMAELTGFPAVAEYLTHREELQQLVLEITEILQNGINTPK